MREKHKHTYNHSPHTWLILILYNKDTVIMCFHSTPRQCGPDYLVVRAPWSWNIAWHMENCMCWMKYWYIWLDFRKAFPWLLHCWRFVRVELVKEKLLHEQQKVRCLEVFSKQREILWASRLWDQLSASSKGPSIMCLKGREDLCGWIARETSLDTSPSTVLSLSISPVLGVVVCSSGNIPCAMKLMQVAASLSSS